MALKGNLQDFSLTQLLNLINLSHKTGTLIVERSNEAASLFFMEGKLAYAQIANEDNSLVGVLHKTQQLSPGQYSGIKQHVNGMTDKELGLILVNANYFSQQDILTSLQKYCVDVLDRLFTWMEGLFQFETGTMPPRDKIIVRVNLENLILDGTRRMKELEFLQDEIPSLDIAIKFVDRPGVNVRNLNLTKEEWKVINYVHPRNSLRQISRVTKLNDSEIRRIVYSLLEAGIVELIRPVEAKPQTHPSIQSPASMTSTEKEERKSLLSRIIDRIRAL
jgi:Domain of unknown function (DUF4388)